MRTMLRGRWKHRESIQLILRSTIWSDIPLSTRLAVPDKVQRESEPTLIQVPGVLSQNQDRIKREAISTAPRITMDSNSGSGRQVTLESTNSSLKSALTMSLTMKGILLRRNRSLYKIRKKYVSTWSRQKLSILHHVWATLNLPKTSTREVGRILL